MQTARYLAEEGAEGESDDTFGWKKHAFTREEEIIMAEYLLAFVVLLVSTLLLQFFVGKVWKLTYLPESGATILFGMVIGGIMRLSGADNRTVEGQDDFDGSDLLGFNTTIFFIGFLPPIIFNAGYMIKRRLFFANLGGILSLAFIGTALSAWLVGYALWALGQGGASYKLSIMEGICFGSLISATDPVSTLAVFTELRVDPTLFYLVFGESVMNDAVAITLFRTTGKFVGMSIGAEEFFTALVDFVLSFAGSVIIGYALGIFSAWIFKTVDMSHHRLVLVSVFVGMVYIPFFLAEAFQLSGIVTILFGAITARRYSAQNMPPGAKRASAFVFEILAYLSETSVFLYIGLNVFSKASARSYQGGLILWTLFLIIVGRAMHVYPLLAWVNWYREKRAKEKNRRPNLIPMSTKHMVFFSGLRGAVAYACANIFPDQNGNREVIVCTTMMIALITIFLKGGFTLKMLEILGIQKDVDPGPYVEKLKKQAKPYRFLLWEQQYIYPIVIKGYDQLRANGMDVSSEGGSAHFGNSNHGHGGHDEGHEEAAAAHEQLTHKADDDDDDIQDGVQLARGYANSSGHVAPSTLVHSAEKDSLW